MKSRIYCLTRSIRTRRHIRRRPLVNSPHLKTLHMKMFKWLKKERGYCCWISPALECVYPYREPANMDAMRCPRRRKIVEPDVRFSILFSLWHDICTECKISSKSTGDGAPIHSFVHIIHFCYFDLRTQMLHACAASRARPRSTSRSLSTWVTWTTTAKTKTCKGDGGNANPPSHIRMPSCSTTTTIRFWHRAFAYKYPDG